MSFNPKYTITDKILNNLTDIASACEVIKQAHLVPKWETKLRRQALLRSAHASTALAGNKLSLKQVKERVLEGGHDVPPNDVRRRFSRGISNFFNLYEPLLDSWMLFDNSKAKPVLIAKRRNGHREILDEKLFALVQKT